MSISISGSGAITFSDGSAQNTAATGFGFKNRIINGAMVIDQRNAGASVTPNNNYMIDRFGYGNTQTGKFTAQQITGGTETGYATRVASGFQSYLALTSSSAYPVGSGDTFLMLQPIEANNISDFAWGTANAKTVTLSFLVYSSLTGTFGGAVANYASTRSYPFSYTISSANTWTQISVTIPGDTSGTWVMSGTGGAMIVRFGLGSGSTFSGTVNTWATGNLVQPTGTVSVVGTNGATFYITGVQLEKGSTATAYDYRPYGTELALCQRYYQQYQSTSGRLGWLIANGPYNGTAAIFNTIIPLQVMMRASPSVSYSGLAYYNNGVGSLPNFNTIYSSTYSPFSLNIQWSGGSGGYGGVALGELHTGSGYLAASAEL